MKRVRNAEQSRESRQISFPRVWRLAYKYVVGALRDWRWHLQGYLGENRLVFCSLESTGTGDLIDAAFSNLIGYTARFTYSRVTSNIKHASMQIRTMFRYEASSKLLDAHLGFRQRYLMMSKSSVTGITSNPSRPILCKDILRTPSLIESLIQTSYRTHT